MHSSDTTGVHQESNMEQDNSLCGGVSLRYSMVDDKHIYEVENALTYSSNTFRKGDKIFMINNKKTQDLPPKKFIRMLSSESPMLTIHQPNIVKEEGQCPNSDSIHAYGKKEVTKLDFQLVMVREEGLEGEEENRMEPTWKSDNMEDNKLVLLSMTKTSVAVIKGRGNDPENPCSNCSINGCGVNNVIMASKKCEVTSVCRESLWAGDKERVNNVLMYSLLEKIERPLPRRPCRDVSFSENVTISYYQSNIFEDINRGAPVVLNFTGSKNFLKCTRNNQEVVLTVECCEKEKLKNICKDDPATWPYVFYMKTEGANNRLFESAANKGWFIRTEKPRASVWVGNPTEKNMERFYFLIYLKQ